MAVKANGTHAKEIAIHFLNLTTDGRYTSAIVSRSIGTVKSLLLKGYTKEEIMETIDYCHDVKKVNMFSIGYISHAINDTLREIRELQAAEKKREEAKKIQASVTSLRKEEVHEQSSSERNRAKVERNRIQSSIGTKFDFNMLKE